MDHCGTWRSSYRLVLELVQDIGVKPHFTKANLLIVDGDDPEAVSDDALWDVVFTRIGAIQEYGWHSGLERLMWATDELNGALVSFDWKELQPQLVEFSELCTKEIISHAKAEDEFFPTPPPASTDHMD
jgi:hypothetical protein